MPDEAHLVPDLTSLLSAAPADSIISRTVFGDEHVKVTLFALPPARN